MRTNFKNVNFRLYQLVSHIDKAISGKDPRWLADFSDIDIRSRYSNISEFITHSVFAMPDERLDLKNHYRYILTESSKVGPSKILAVISVYGEEKSLRLMLNADLTNSLAEEYSKNQILGRLNRIRSAWWWFGIKDFKEHPELIGFHRLDPLHITLKNARYFLWHPYDPVGINHTQYCFSTSGKSMYNIVDIMLNFLIREKVFII